jgi:regulator of sigma E protease
MSVILFIVILLVLVVGHEFGHFSVAKWVGMKVHEFGVGFPPKLWSKTIGETEYSVNALPFGGFVKIHGEDDPELTEDQAFAMHSKLAQAGVLFAGPGMNIVLGFMAFWIAFSIGVPAAVDETHGTLKNARVVVSELLPGSPIAKSGIKVGDTLLTLTQDNVTKTIQDPKDISAALATNHNRLAITAKRGDAVTVYILEPVAGIIKAEPDRYAIGLGSLLVGTTDYGIGGAFVKALGATWNGLVGIVVGMATLIASAFTLSGSLADLSGPVGIAGLVGDAAVFGVGQVLALAAVISLNLAVLNLLPFPALDGGRLAMLAYEVVRGKRIRQQTAAIINTVGFVALILLMLVVTWHDIAKLLM